MFFKKLCPKWHIYLFLYYLFKNEQQIDVLITGILKMERCHLHSFVIQGKGALRHLGRLRPQQVRLGQKQNNSLTFRGKVPSDIQGKSALGHLEAKCPLIFREGTLGYLGRPRPKQVRLVRLGQKQNQYNLLWEDLRGVRHSLISKYIAYS